MSAAGVEREPESVTIDHLAAVCGGVIHGLASSDGIAIVDVTHDSRQVGPRWLYCCIPGANVNGHDFAPAAVSAGASAVLAERELDLAVPRIVVDDARAVMGLAAAEVHGRPSDHLTVIGVTGTNGKSSVVQLLDDIFRRAGSNTEIIGTVKGARTTPESSDLQRLLARAVRDGVLAIAMEVSSHALSLHRVVGTRFAAAVFTNLGRDHLDFHGTVEAYFEAKSRLFVDDFSAMGVINTDDPYGRRLADMARSSMETVLTYDLAQAEGLGFDGPVARFRWRGHRVRLPLAGAHNVRNALAAATTAVALGVSEVDVVSALAETRPVRGRFESVEGGQPFHVAVDYAHTPDALQSALAAARQVAGDNRVLVIFGCGGDRDVRKRPEMGQVAEKGADVVVITSDNPRSEDPMAIIDSIIGGLRDPKAALVEPDRRAAIAAGLSRAEPGDVVLIAGKGHETYQIVGDQTLAFDDRQVALTVLGAAT